jgi:hypothetical protein
MRTIHARACDQRDGLDWELPTEVQGPLDELLWLLEATGVCRRMSAHTRPSAASCLMPTGLTVASNGLCSVLLLCRMCLHISDSRRPTPRQSRRSERVGWGMRDQAMWKYWRTMCFLIRELGAGSSPIRASVYGTKSVERLLPCWSWVSQTGDHFQGMMSRLRFGLLTTWQRSFFGLSRDLGQGPSAGSTGISLWTRCLRSMRPFP